MSGSPASVAPILVCSSFCVAARSDLSTKLMTKVALRGSAPPPRIWPPKMREERTSCMARSFSEIARVTRSVSSRCEPGGSSTASSARTRFVGGNEAGRQELRRPARRREDEGAGEQRDPAMAQQGCDKARIAAHDQAVDTFRVVRRAQEIGGDDRRHEAGD